MSRTGRRISRPSIRGRPGSGGLLPLVALTGESKLLLFLESCVHFLWLFLLLRPPSPSKRQAVGSVESPAITTPAAPAESGGSGSAKGQSTSRLSVVLKFTKLKKFVLKNSSQ